MDPNALDAAAGARARLRIEVPSRWLDAGAAIELTAPRRLVCARCDGGGCDACGRSGALCAPEDAAARRVGVVLPQVLASPQAGERRAVLLRLPEPFGPEHAIAQLLVEVHAADGPSPGVIRVDRALPPPRPIPWPAIAAAVLAAASIAAALWGR